MEILNEILDLFLTSWAVHWQLKGSSNIAIHHELGEFYDELKDFADEYVETELTNGELVTNIFPLNPRVKEVIQDPVNTVVRQATALRKSVVLVKDPILQDWCGRLISRLTHYIFLLGTPPASAKLFSKDPSNELLNTLKKLFNDQNEFVTIFNAWLHSKKVDANIDLFFRQHQDELLEISDTILNTNKELFSLKEVFQNLSDEAKSEYNYWVNYFDAF